MKFLRIKLISSLKIHAAGFTLIEVMIAMAIVGFLASIAVPNYVKYREKARIQVAMTGMKFIEKEIIKRENLLLLEDLAESIKARGKQSDGPLSANTCL